MRGGAMSADTTPAASPSRREAMNVASPPSAICPAMLTGLQS